MRFIKQRVKQGLNKDPLCFLDYVQAIKSLATQTVDRAMPPVSTLATDGPEDAWTPDDIDAYCFKCGRTTGQHEATPSGCSGCLDQRLPWQTITRLSEYKAPLTGWIKAMKYHGQWPIAEWLAKEMATTIREATNRQGDAAAPAVVTHVPMHHRRRLARGYDQAQILAEGVGRSLNLPTAPLLKRVMATPKQSTVNRQDRIKNVKNAFAAAEVDLTGVHVLLIDDVKTSGATLKACTRTLKRAGATRIDAAVLAVAHQG